MTTSYRHLAALAVGATLTLGLVSGCATPHTPEGYVSEARSTIPSAEQDHVTDQQLLIVGRMMCAYPESITTTSFENDAPPEYVELSQITASYCDVLGPDGGPVEAMPDPMAAAPVAAESSAAPLPPTPISVGVPVTLNYGGTEDISTTTINKVTRCGGEYLILDVTVKTGNVWSTNDSIMESIDYTDSSGVTRDAPGYSGIGSSCGDYDDALPMSMDMKPGKTYQGLLQYEVPIGATTTLELEGTDGLVRTLDVTGK